MFCVFFLTKFIIIDPTQYLYLCYCAGDICLGVGDVGSDRGADPPVRLGLVAAGCALLLLSG